MSDSDNHKGGDKLESATSKRQSVATRKSGAGSKRKSTVNKKNISKSAAKIKASKNIKKGGKKGKK